MTRIYPTRPVVGILAMVQRGNRFLLVERSNPPDQGKWGFPGGVQELGETVFEAATRELTEETGVVATDPRVLHAFDAIYHDPDGRVEYHYTLIVVLSQWLEGEGAAADDARALAWVGLDELDRLPTSASVAQLVVQALELGRG